MKKLLLISLLLVSFVVPSSAQKIVKPTKPRVARQKVVKPIKPDIAVQTPLLPKTTESLIVDKVLPNGLEIIVLPDSSVPIVTIEFACRNGSFTEPPELNGLSHLYEHMFFKPNQAVRQGEEYTKKLDNLGFLNNAETHEEVVNYYFNTTSPHLETAIRFMKDSVRFPTFNADELDAEKQVVIGEIDRNESNPFFFLKRTMDEKLFYKYPSRKTPLGTRETVSSATVEKMKTIQSRYYVPNNSALVITGDVDPVKVFALAERYFGDWKARNPEPFKEFPLVEHPPLTKSEGYIVEQPIQLAVIQIGWHGPSIGKDTKGTYVADVFSYILAQPDSRFQRTMVDSGLTVGAGLNYYTQRNVGPINLQIVTSPDKAKDALKTVYAEIDKFTQPDYFTADELTNATTLLESRDLFSREKLSDYSHTLSFWWSSTGIDYFRSYYKNMRQTTGQDITGYVKTYIQNKPRIVVALLSSEAQSQVKLTERDLIGEK
jgi:zinc protease